MKNLLFFLVILTTVSFAQGVTVIAPNGGEQWEVGTTQTISWSQVGLLDVSVSYTYDGGTPIPLGTYTASDGAVSWTIPNTPSNNCIVYLVGWDGFLNYTDFSEAPFEIVSPPSVTVTAPNGGQTWQSGSSQNITWTSTGVTSVNIEYSTDNGSSWVSTPIATGVTASLGTYSWTVPDMYSDQCLVRISDASDGTINDVSDAVFTIENRTLAVTSPNDSEFWKPTTTETITWTSSNITNVKLEYTVNGGTNWDVIETTTPSDGSYDWTVPAITSPSCLVRITDADNGGMSDISDDFFFIIEPFLSVIAPDGGQSWQSGSVQPISWTTTFVSDVIIEYSSDNGSNWNVISNSYNSGSVPYYWTVPSVYSTQCLVRISDKDAPTYSDVSDGVFTIDNRGVTVTSPNTGTEVWESGTAKAITWTSSGVTNVKIEYSTNSGGAWSTVVNSMEASVGSFVWTVPNTPSTQCLVKISDVSDGTVNDQSDNEFEIFAPSVTVATPNGNEIYRSGTVETITWSASGIDNVKIEYSTDSGSNWTLIDPSVAGSLGTFDWTVPNVTSIECLIRLSDELDPAIADVSDGLFSIIMPSVTFNFNGGWNVMSAPFVLDDPDANNVFPTKISDIFTYSYGYYIIYNIQPAQGFWVKFPSAGSNTVYGSGNSDSTVQVFAGWNIIGAPEYDVLVADISSTPAGIVISDFYEYGGGYTPVTTLVEGKGYWVKCSQPGTLLLPRQTGPPKVEPLFTPEENWITVTVSDAAGNSQQLYVADENGMFELPPVPPNDIFDVRFGDDSYLCTEDALSRLRFQSEDYPLTISVSGGNLKLTDGATGTIINRQLLDGESLTITNKNISNLNINTVEIPADYVLYQNYPNPFNPATTIKFGLPMAGKVDITVYNQLGQKVETLISQELEAGYHELEWNAMQYSSGVYFYTINAGNFKSVKKMLLLK